MIGGKKLWILGGVILLLGIGLYVFKSKSSTKPTYEEYPVFRGNLQITAVATGTVKPENRLEIKPPIAGRIDQVLIKEGEEVKKGQVLAIMSSTERAALLDAARSQDKDEVKKWESLYRPTPILAPLDGTIILRSIEAGQTVTNTDAILVMSDRLIVKAQVDETDMGLIELGQKADIILDAYSKEKITAQVDHIAFESTTTNNVTTYDIDILPDETPKFMRSGMTANVTFYVNTKENALLIPTEVITYENGRPTVLVKNSDDSRRLSFTKKELQIGLSDGKNSEILDGLSDGDIILSTKVIIGDRVESSNPFQPNFRRRKR